MNPQEQRIADALIDRIRQRRDTIDPELAQRIHQGLQSAPDAFYLLAQAAVAQGVQLEMMQALQNAAPQAGWQGQPPPPQQQKPGFLESIFGPGQPSPAVPMYGQAQGYPQPPYPGTAPSAVQATPGQPLGSAGYQAVNANLPGANATPVPQYQQPGYGQPYQGQPQYGQQGYGANQYQSQPYPPQQGYGAPSAPSGYSTQAGYGQAPYGQPAYPVPVQPGYPQAGSAAYPPPSGYPSGGGWAQPGGGMLSGMGGVVAGAAAGALVTGAVESVVHGYENHERREEEMAREEHRDHDDSWRSDHNHGLADTSADKDDSNFYNPSHDASRSDDSSQSQFADTDDDSGSGDSDDSDSSSNDDDTSSDDASDFGGFSNDNSNS